MDACHITLIEACLSKNDACYSNVKGRWSDLGLRDAKDSPQLDNSNICTI